MHLRKASPPPKGLEDGTRIENLNISISNWMCLQLMFEMGMHPEVFEIMGKMRAGLYRAPVGSLTYDQPATLCSVPPSPYGT